jgi:hypothetical protein
MDIRSVANPDNQHQKPLSLYLVDDAVIADTQPVELLLAGKFFDPARVRILSE